jgi:RNA polymerase sigma factor (TIGR02999 family)
MPDSLTLLLQEWRDGNQDAANQLFAAAYEELHRIANWHFDKEPRGHTLQPTALVHELYLKLFAGAAVDWQNRAHFFAVAAQQLRRLLVDHARARRAAKREGNCVQVSLTEALGVPREEDLMELDLALGRLEALDAGLARLVEMRFFGGLTEKEAAEVMQVSVSTVKRDWEFAKSWLAKELSPTAE